MYSDWASLLPEIQSESVDQGVLSRFSYSTSREVVSGIVRNLSSNMAKCREGLEANVLVTDSDVTWTMDIMCFGLSLPATDREVTSECVSIYCEWMSCLVDPQASVPAPLVEEPNKYFCRMLTHLVHLFKPRSDAGPEYTTRHVAMCSTVMKTVQSVASKSNIMTSESWDSLLKFLLSVCDILLGPPTVKDDLGSQMCERMLSGLFETWLISCCSGHFPSPSLWKTLHEMCLGWRHHEALVAQWHRVNVALTSQLLRMFHGPGAQSSWFSSSSSSSSMDDDGLTQTLRASNDVIIQCWFRFLHVIGNPIDFSRPRVISSTQRFLHAALSSQEVVEPYQHECLRALPRIFYEAMKCVSVIAAAFLGSNQKSYAEMDNLASATGQGQNVEPPSVTPPPARKQQRASFFPLIKNKDASSRMSLGEAWQVPTTPVASQPMPSAQPSAPVPQVPPSLFSSGAFSFLRPKVNSLLHLLGGWLFDAALVGADVIGPQKAAPDHSRSPSSLATTTVTSLLNPPEEDWGNDGLQQYEAGRAQACGTLCRIFCSTRTDEEILSTYVSRFYTVLYYGLKVDLLTSSHPVLINIVLNSSDIFKVNLIGSQVMVPHYLRAVEFLQTMFKYRHQDNVDEDVDQRHASIQLLLSMLCMPLHFRNLEIKNILDDQRHQRPTSTFYSLLPTLASLLLKILSREVDPLNIQMLLGGVALLVADMAVYEEKSRSSTKGSTQLLELYDKVATLVCERLIKSWTPELSSALSAMEVLQSFSTLRSLKSSKSRTPGEGREGNATSPRSADAVLEATSKKIAVTICDFVVLQCNKPAKYHSKDLHSSIVSAYQCLTTWLVEHDYLLQDSSILHTVLQVTELGISGSRSQPRPTDAPVYKGNKELKPISQRVKDAAEALLATIVDHVGSFPSPSGPESLCTLLDEESFLGRCDKQDVSSPPKFQYFVVDGSVILGLYEPPPMDDADMPPTLVVITRSLFGRHVWLLKLCHQSRTKNITTQSSTTSVAAAPDEALKVVLGPQGSAQTSTPAEAPRHFPDSVTQAAKVLADSSIPPIEKTMLNYEEQLENLRKIIEDQKVFEEESQSEHLKNYRPPPSCEPPSSPRISNAARLFLSHFGFLTLDNLRGGSVTGGLFPTLTKLNDADPNLWLDLKALDGVSVRTADVVHVYYVRRGQNKIEDVLANVLSELTVSPDFEEFLLSLGWPVDISSHPGWTGNPSTSWKVRDGGVMAADNRAHSTGGSCYDGTERVLYWADVSTELVFIVPSRDSVIKSDIPATDSSKPSRPANTLDGGQAEVVYVATSGDSNEGVPRMRRQGRAGAQGAGGDVQVIVVWLEHYEDHATFPLDDLSKLSNHQQAAGFKSQRLAALGSGSFCAIFIHPLRTGLFRVHLQVPSSRAGDAGPLVDGAVVSRRVLGQMVRQTAYNVYKRKVLESDVHQPPHVRRRIAIKEIIQRHKCPMTESDFCTSLFQC